MSDNIIPFGRYKGKPIEVLATDKEYVNWLIEQPFFREKHINLYNVVINNFREPSDTPEHNKIQIKFLKPEYRCKLAYLLNPNFFEYNNDSVIKRMQSILDSTSPKEQESFIHSLGWSVKLNKDGKYSAPLYNMPEPNFERIDVSYNIEYGFDFGYSTYSKYYEAVNTNLGLIRRAYFAIEIKPTVGDDFPAVLRQMKASMPVQRSSVHSTNYFLLLVGRYTGTSVTQEDFILYFQSQGYRVVFENDIDNCNLPAIDFYLKLNSDIEDRVIKFKTENR